MMLCVELELDNRKVGHITVHSALVEKNCYRWVVTHGGRVITGRICNDSSDPVVLLWCALSAYRLLRQANDEE
jgi:hypothetical protein